MPSRRETIKLYQRSKMSDVFRRAARTLVSEGTRFENPAAFDSPKQRQRKMCRRKRETRNAAESMKLMLPGLSTAKSDERMLQRQARGELQRSSPGE